MGVPKKKSTKTSKKQRASHFALKRVNLINCPKCKKPVLLHHLCSFCGYYRGKEVLKVKTTGKKGLSLAKSRDKKEKK